MKRCSRCKALKSLDDFCRDASRVDGRSYVCISCRRVPPRQLLLIRETQAEYERRRYATDETYRASRRQHSHSRRRGVEPLPVEAMELLTEMFAGRCAYCPSPAASWDHLVPVSKGGRTVPGNIVPACVSCNSSKNNRDLFDFIEQNGVVITAALEGAIALAAEKAIYG